MKNIATIVDDSAAVLEVKVARQQQKPGYAIDSYFYRSHVAYQRELERLVFRSWLYAAHTSQLSAAGDYVLFEVGEDSIIVCRDESGEVRAMHNICRHRGARVCEAASGNRKTFVCPYHGWVYNTDGSLRAAREMDVLEGFRPQEHGLKPVRVTVHMGLVFVNLDPHAASFDEPLAKLSPALGAYALADAKVAHRQTYRVDANWKLCLENYLECYHCATSHRDYARLHTLKELAHKVAPINDAMLARAESVTGVSGIGLEHYEIYNQASAFGCCSYTSRYALYDGYRSGSEDGQPVAPLMGNMQGYDGGAGDFQFGPLTFMLCYPDHCVLYRFVPRGLTATDMEVVWFVNGDAEEGADYDVKRLTWLWHHTTLEDEYIITRNSEGVNSSFFEPGPYHPEYESICIDFVSWYLATMARRS